MEESANMEESAIESKIRELSETFTDKVINISGQNWKTELALYSTYNRAINNQLNLNEYKHPDNTATFYRTLMIPESELLVISGDVSIRTNEPIENRVYISQCEPLAELGNIIGQQINKKYFNMNSFKIPDCMQICYNCKELHKLPSMKNVSSKWCIGSIELFDGLNFKWGSELFLRQLMTQKRSCIAFVNLKRIVTFQDNFKFSGIIEHLIIRPKQLKTPKKRIFTDDDILTSYPSKMIEGEEEEEDNSIEEHGVKRSKNTEYAEWRGKKMKKQHKSYSVQMEEESD